MSASERGHFPNDLLQARSRFQAWRAGRQIGSRIPPHLWSLAVQLVDRHGISQTALALGLDYYRLKKRVEESGGEPKLGGPAFVELPSSVAVGKQGLFELDNGAGATMRVRLVGYDTADVEALARRFWNNA